MIRTLLASLVFLLINGSICVPSVSGGSPELKDIRVPEGFAISIYAADVKNARAMCWGEKGTLFVGSRSAGIVHALKDTDNDGDIDERFVIATGLNMPVGVAFKDGDLYVSAVDKIVRLQEIEDKLNDPPKPEIVIENYPSEESHGWKFIAFGPDGQLYIPVGAPCNDCLSEDNIFATITRIKTDGTGREIIANGVRNTVGFDWHPETGVLWFTENGRDWMGDDIPPCELNRLDRLGDHYGFPYCHGSDIPDPKYGKERPCSEFVPPLLKMQAHTAPLGMRFYRGSQFPGRYRNAIFIAQHGSWNRSTPVGYQVIVAFPQKDGSVLSEVFADGWLNGSKASGRPVDVLEAPDGSLLVSDDDADMIYRISYSDR
ncbi:MAG: sorbosone dehydrogenase family protein [Bacteroidota bacterium]|nr:sorbosone dehydrogenase family protein [Bacteroidota bacterium]